MFSKGIVKCRRYQTPLPMTSPPHFRVAHQRRIMQRTPVSFAHFPSRYFSNWSAEKPWSNSTPMAISILAILVCFSSQSLDPLWGSGCGLPPR